MECLHDTRAYFGVSNGNHFNLKSRPNDILTLLEAAGTSQNILRNRARYRSNVNFIPTVSALPSFGHGMVYVQFSFTGTSQDNKQPRCNESHPETSHS